MCCLHCLYFNYHFIPPTIGILLFASVTLRFLSHLSQFPKNKTIVVSEFYSHDLVVFPFTETTHIRFFCYFSKSIIFTLYIAPFFSHHIREIGRPLIPLFFTAKYASLIVPSNVRLAVLLFRSSLPLNMLPSLSRPTAGYSSPQNLFIPSHFNSRHEQPDASLALTLSPLNQYNGGFLSN